jgi:hypothetical protein
MYYADGGEFNAAHSVENVLKNDSSVYWYIHLMAISLFFVFVFVIPLLTVVKT